MLMVLLSFFIKVIGQTVTLGGSVVPFSQNVYNPGTPITVNLNCVVNGGTANNVQIICDLPSTVTYLAGGTLGFDTLNNVPAVIFSFPSIEANGTANGIGVQFQVQFPSETNCLNSTAVFAPRFTATGLTSFQSSPVTISSDATYGTVNWLVNDAIYRLTNINNGALAYWSESVTTPAITFPFYSNSSCANCNDSFYLPIQFFNGGQKDIENATLYFTVNQSVSNVQLIDYSTKSPLPYTSTGSNSTTFSYNPNGTSGNTNMMVKDNSYYKQIEFVVNPGLFNGQSICVNPVLKGTNCDGSPYSNPFAQQCFAVQSQPAQIVLGHSIPTVSIGCDGYVSYSLGSDNSCNQSCPQLVRNATIQFDSVPTNLHINSIVVPDVTGNDTAILTGHYYCTSSHTSNSFSFSYNAAYLLVDESRDIVSLAQLVNGNCDIANSYITDYKIATSINSTPSNLSIPMGEVNFTVLPSDWKNPSVLTTTGIPANFYAKYNSQIQSGDSIATAALLVLFSAYPEVYLNDYICNRKDVYCFGDTVEYNINFSNVGFGAVYAGKILATLPGGFKYVPNSTQLKSYPSNLANYNVCLCPSCIDTSLGTNQPFTPDFSNDVASGTPLIWTVPVIDNSCNGTPPVYDISFKAVITNNAVYQFSGSGISADVQNSSSNSVFQGGFNNTNIQLCPPQAVLSPSEQVSLDGVNWVQDTSVIAGQKVFYRITLKNNGNVPLTQIKLVDILPAIGDPSVSNCDTPRNSTAFVSLIDSLSEPSGTNIPVLYSLSSSPSRYSLLGNTGTAPACESGIFQPLNTIHTSIQNISAFEINYGSAVLLPGESNVYTYAALVPIGPLDSSKAYNSFAATATITGSNVLLKGPESQNVTLTVVKPSCQCVEGTVWVDSIPNSVQDSSEIGINGINISILDSATGTLKGSAITTYDINKTPGHYQFCSLPPGSYYVIAAIPDSLIHPPKPDSAGVIIADTLIIQQQTGSFTIDCSKATSNVDDIIIRTTTDCDDDCSKRRPILFKQLFR